MNLLEIEIVDTCGEEAMNFTRRVQYQDADCFMICVPANSSLQNALFWLAEIREVQPTKPIALILTKSDLYTADQQDSSEETLTMDDILNMKREHGLTLAAKTSSKAWEDLNVHSAFNRAIMAAY